jgi:hypothetical protein
MEEKFKRKERESPLTFEERLSTITSLYKEGVEGNQAAVQEANQLLEQLRLDYPDHPLAEAYHGGIMILIARDKTNPLERLRWAKNGLKLLDKAVAAAPHDIIIRSVRGRSAYRLPEKYFQRTRTVIEDYTFLLNQEVQLEVIGIDKSRLTYELGEAYRRIGRNGDAANCWTKLEQETQDPEFRQLLRQKLQSLEGKPAIEHIQANDSPESILMERAARAVGSALLRWVEKKTNKEALRKEPKKKKELRKEALRKDTKRKEMKKDSVRKKTRRIEKKKKPVRKYTKRIEKKKEPVRKYTKRRKASLPKRRIRNIRRFGRR